MSPIPTAAPGLVFVRMRRLRSNPRAAGWKSRPLDASLEAQWSESALKFERSLINGETQWSCWIQTQIHCWWNKSAAGGQWWFILLKLLWLCASLEPRCSVLGLFWTVGGTLRVSSYLLRFLSRPYLLLERHVAFRFKSFALCNIFLTWVFFLGRRDESIWEWTVGGSFLREVPSALWFKMRCNLNLDLQWFNPDF